MGEKLIPIVGSREPEGLRADPQKRFLTSLSLVGGAQKCLIKSSDPLTSMYSR